MNIEVQSEKGIQVASDILVLGFFNEKAPPRGLAGELDWLLNNTLSLLIKSGKVKGGFGERILVSANRIRTSKILWTGLGKRESYNHAKIAELAPDLYSRLEKLEVQCAYLDLWDIEGCSIDFSSALNAFLNGLFDSRDFSAEKEKKTIDLTFHVRDPERVKDLNRFLKGKEFRTRISAGTGK